MKEQGPHGRPYLWLVPLSILMFLAMSRRRAGVLGIHPAANRDRGPAVPPVDDPPSRRGDPHVPRGIRRKSGHRALCQGIIASQQAEITEMKALLAEPNAVGQK